MLDWLRKREKPTPYGVLEHTRALRDLPVFCTAGEKDDESICPDLKGDDGRDVALLPGAHHYQGQYGKLAAGVADFLDRRLAAITGTNAKPRDREAIRADVPPPPARSRRIR